MYTLLTEYNSTVYPMSKSHCMKKLNCTKPTTLHTCLLHGNEVMRKLHISFC